MGLLLLLSRSLSGFFMTRNLNQSWTYDICESFVPQTSRTRYYHPRVSRSGGGARSLSYLSFSLLPSCARPSIRRHPTHVWMSHLRFQSSTLHFRNPHPLATSLRLIWALEQLSHQDGKIMLPWRVRPGDLSLKPSNPDENLNCALTSSQTPATVVWPRVFQLLSIGTY